MKELPSGVPACDGAWPAFVRVRPAASSGSGVTFAARGLPTRGRRIAAGPRIDSFAGFQLKAPMAISTAACRKASTSRF
jgi:hypothetical protein